MKRFVFISFAAMVLSGISSAQSFGCSAPRSGWEESDDHAVQRVSEAAPRHDGYHTPTLTCYSEDFWKKKSRHDRDDHGRDRDDDHDGDHRPVPEPFSIVGLGAIGIGILRKKFAKS